MTDTLFPGSLVSTEGLLTYADLIKDKKLGKSLQDINDDIKTQIDVLNGDGEGSINKIVSSLKADLDSNKEEVINKLNQHIEQADKGTLAIRNDISSLKDKDTTLEGSISKEITDRKDADKDIIDNKIPEAISKVVADAPEKFDTLKEIADYIKSDETRAAQIISLVDEMHKALEREVITLTYAGYKNNAHYFSVPTGDEDETDFDVLYYRQALISYDGGPADNAIIKTTFIKVKYKDSETTPGDGWLLENKIYKINPIISYLFKDTVDRDVFYINDDGIEEATEADVHSLLKVDTDFDYLFTYFYGFLGNTQEFLGRDIEDNKEAIETLQKNKTTVNLYTGLSDVQSKMEPLDEGSIAIFILFDLSGKGTLDANTSQQLLGKNEITGFSSGDLLIMAKYTGGQLGMIIPTQDVKSKVGSFPGAMGLASPDDKLRIESIPQLYAGENFVPGSYNADQCLEPGTYFKMTTGRSMTPNDDDETYLLVVTPRKTYDNGYQNAMQIAYSLKYAGKSHYRYIEFNPDKQFTKFTDWADLTTSKNNSEDTLFEVVYGPGGSSTPDTIKSALTKATKNNVKVICRGMEGKIDQSLYCFKEDHSNWSYIWFSNSGGYVEVGDIPDISAISLTGSWKDKFWSSTMQPATTTSNGLMSASDKQKLDSLSTSLSNISDYTEEDIDEWFKEDYVDLGLPSGTLWATKNIGAETEYDDGLYFQWGDTQGYTAEQIKNGEKVFDWDHYKYGNYNPNYLNKGMVKYDHKYNSSVCEDGDDAAFVATSGKFKMPTYTQINELIDNTNHTFVDDSNGKYVKFINKTDNSKFIVLPLVGEVAGKSIFYADVKGYYWTSSIYTLNFPKSCYLFLDNSNNNVDSSPVNYRYYGMTIRGVLNK